MKKAALISLLFLYVALPIFCKQLATLPGLLNPTMMETNKKEIFILDGAVVYVYSLDNYKLLRSFGKRGEGPGEILTSPENPLNMKLSGDNVLLHTFFKVIFFSAEGCKIEEFNIPVRATQVLPFGKYFAVAKYLRNSGGESKIKVCLYDMGFNEVKTLYENTLSYNIRKGRLPMPLYNIHIYKAGDRLLVCDQQEDHSFKVFDIIGNPLPPLKIDIPKIKINDEFKSKILAWLETQPVFKGLAPAYKKKVTFNDYLPRIRRCTVADNKLFVQTYRTRDHLSEFLVFDFQGKLLNKLYLPGADKEQMRPNPAATFAFLGNNYFYLVEDEEKEEWQLHMETIGKD